MRFKHLFLGLLYFGQLSFSQESGAGQVFETMQVFRKTVEVRVTDRKGQPIRDLKPGDFALTLAGVPVPVLLCEWHERAVSGFQFTADGESVVREKNTLKQAPGRKLVFFFQGDFSGQRNTGVLKGAHHSREMIKGLKKDDWVAVFSYVSHLKMHSDWTTDPRQINDAIDDAFRNNDEFWPADDPFHCLEDHFDLEKARSIASPEASLGYIGEILIHEDGVKNLFYVGWGLGRLSREGVRMTYDYGPAVQKLTQANVAVFSLDISQADYHSLEAGMKRVSEETGGFYERTYPFTAGSFKRVLKAAEGYYLLTFEPPGNELEEMLNYTLKLVEKEGQVFVKKPQFW